MLRLLVGLLGAVQPGAPGPRQADTARQIVTLPSPRQRGPVSVEEALAARRSVRRYGGGALSLAELSQLLWAAQGVTSGEGGRTAPSAGARYPLEVFVVAWNVTGLPPGVYRYRASRHDLVSIGTGDRRSTLAAAAPTQAWITGGAAALVIAGVYERTTARYGERGVRYVHMEVGHVAQNVYLEAAALRIGTVFVGAFQDGALSRGLALPESEHPLCIMPLGRLQ